MAQRSKTTFKATKNSRFANNATGAITEANSRDMYEDVADSALFVEDNAYSSFIVTASGINTYTATLSPTIAAYESTHKYFILFTSANTGAATLNLNALGAKTIVKNGSTALAAGDIAAGQVCLLAYDGTNMQIVGKIADSSVTLASGVWTPTLTNIANTSARTAYEGQYSRVGNTVTFSGTLDMTVTASATATTVSISLPIASNFGGFADASGVGYSDGKDQSAILYAESASDLIYIHFVSIGTGVHTFRFTCTYQVI